MTTKRKSFLLVSILFSLILVVLGACNPKIEKHSFVSEQEIVKTTLNFDVKGDEVVHFNQVAVMDISQMDQKTLESIEVECDRAEEMVTSLDGGKYSVEKEDNTLTEIIDIPLDSEEKVKEMIQSGLLMITSKSEGEIQRISFKESKDALLANGWTEE